jgi:hypothetical protein
MGYFGQFFGENSSPKSGNIFGYFLYFTFPPYLSVSMHGFVSIFGYFGQFFRDNRSPKSGNIFGYFLHITFFSYLSDHSWFLKEF